MIYKEEKKDLFLVDEGYKGYMFAHCISADFALGAGIAVQFNKRFDCKKRLLEIYPSTRVSYWDELQDESKGMCIFTYPVYNLITKRNYWNKPTLHTIKKALLKMKKDVNVRNVKKIAMPKIGCGLDGQRWEDVSKIIKEVFDDTDVEILVCYI